MSTHNHLHQYDVHEKRHILCHWLTSQKSVRLDSYWTRKAERDRKFQSPYQRQTMRGKCNKCNLLASHILSGYSLRALDPSVNTAHFYVFVRFALPFHAFFDGKAI